MFISGPFFKFGATFLLGSSALSHYLLEVANASCRKRSMLVLSGFWAIPLLAFPIQLPCSIFSFPIFKTNWSQMQLSHKQSTHNKLKRFI